MYWATPPLGELALTAQQRSAALTLYDLAWIACPGTGQPGCNRGGSSDVASDGPQDTYAGLDYAEAQRQLAAAQQAIGLRHSRLVTLVCIDCVPVARCWAACGYESEGHAVMALGDALDRVANCKAMP